MSRSTTYKNYHGSHEELLIKINYELWAPVVRGELEGKDQWGFVDKTRLAPDELPAGSAPSNQLLYRTVLKEHCAEQSATSSYIFNACSKLIQERYLYDSDLAKPDEIWEKL